MGAAAAAAKALKLGNQESRMALGIAASLANGLKENFGTMTKPLHAGNAARNGVIAATLAQRGFTANENILEAPQGFCKVLSGGVQTDLSHLGEGIGKQFNTTMGLAMKPYPSCAGTHASIDNALYLKREYDVSAEEVEEVELRINPAVKTATLYSRPQTGTEGKFSNEYCIARALLEGEVGLKHFTDEKVKEAKAQELLQKVKWIDSTKFAMGSEVVVKLKDGREFSHKVDAPKGSMTSPLTWEDICIKYRDCASLVLSQKEVEHSLEIISHLEELEDTNTLMDILTFGGKKAGS
jgi:2-methylcitrate dehydratase PrpD